MSVYGFTEARQKLKSVCEEVINNSDHVVIHRRDAENVVMLSEAEFNSWKETLYLLKNPVNAKRLFESIEQVSNGQLQERELLDE